MVDRGEARGREASTVDAALDRSCVGDVMEDGIFVSAVEVLLAVSQCGTQVFHTARHLCGEMALMFCIVESKHGHE